MNWLLTGLMMLGVCYLSIVAGMYFMQRSFMYLPARLDTGPADAGLTGVKAITISTSDNEQLQGWYLQAGVGQPTILYLHGNAGSIADRADRLSFYQRQGYGALFLSYRGYGASSGSPTQKGLINDALAAHDWLLKNDTDPDNIVILGESLGAAVAVPLALQRQVRAVILEAPFTSTIDVAKTTYWWLPVDMLMKDRFETIKLIHKVQVPVLIVHGTRDEITSVEQGKKLYARASEPKTLYLIEGASHTGITVEPIWQREQAFIEQLRPQATLPDSS